MPKTSREVAAMAEAEESAVSRVASELRLVPKKVGQSNQWVAWQVRALLRRIGEDKRKVRP